MRRIVALALVVASLGCAWFRANFVDDYVCPDHTLSCTCFDPRTHQGCSDNWFDDITPLEPVGPHMPFQSAHDAGDAGSTSEAAVNAGDSQ